MILRPPKVRCNHIQQLKDHGHLTFERCQVVGVESIVENKTILTHHLHITYLYWLRRYIEYQDKHSSDICVKRIITTGGNAKLLLPAANEVAGG